MSMHLQSKEEKARRMSKEKDEDLLKECSFAPHVNHTRQRSHSPATRQQDKSLFDRLHSEYQVGLQLLK